MPALRGLGIGLIAYSPLRAGPLAGALEAVTAGRASSEMRKRVAAQHEQLEA